MCIDDCVDGISLYKIYTAINIITDKDNCVYYELVDDYGLYNIYKQKRFITVTDELIKNIEEYKKNIKRYINE